jgi:hypothetical protein
MAHTSCGIQWNVCFVYPARLLSSLIISLTPPGHILLANIESVINQNRIKEKGTGGLLRRQQPPIIPDFLRKAFKGSVKNITG